MRAPGFSVLLPVGLVWLGDSGVVLKLMERASHGGTGTKPEPEHRGAEGG